MPPTSSINKNQRWSRIRKTTLTLVRASCHPLTLHSELDSKQTRKWKQSVYQWKWMTKFILETHTKTQPVKWWNGWKISCSISFELLVCQIFIKIDMFRKERKSHCYWSRPLLITKFSDKLLNVKLISSSCPFLNFSEPKSFLLKMPKKVPT